jgi:phosphoribosyl 1,2-cyclic phosphodiesterase
MADHGLRLKVWGARGTLPGPGGDTACVEVASAGRRVIFDAGSGLRGLGAQLTPDDATPIDIFVSHCHIDHLLGLTMFPPVFGGDRPLRLHGFGMADGLRARLARLFNPPLFPVSIDALGAHVRFLDQDLGATLDLGDGARLTSAALDHPGGCAGFRLEWRGIVIAYLTDVELGDREGDARAKALASGADALIIDASYTDGQMPARRGWGHSCWRDAVTFGRDADARRILLFHHEPGRDAAALDAIEQQAEGIFAATQVARDGLTIEFPAIR